MPILLPSGVHVWGGDLRKPNFQGLPSPHDNFRTWQAVIII
jgi:hypothetical protein